MTRSHLSMFRAGLSIALTLAAISCSPEKTVIDLMDESRYAVHDESFLVEDYMLPEADERIDVEAGWTRLTQAGTRLGVYPVSKLYFVLTEVRPLHLFLACAPARNSRRSARSITVSINGNEAAHISLEGATTEVSAVDLIEGHLDAGRNNLEFRYELDPETAARPPDPGEPRRLSSVAFTELILTSASSRLQLRRRLGLEERFLAAQPRALIQRLPGRLDFYLDLPPRSRFEGTCTFLPYEQTAEPAPAVGPRIFVKTPGSPEQQVFPPAGRTPGDSDSVRADLSTFQGPVRLRIQAGNPDPSSSPAGLLTWSEAFIRADHSSRSPGADGRTARRLDELRGFLSTKNTILVILDAARADHFSHSGYFRATTPKIDAFAGGAVVFTKAFSQSLSTRTSMGTLFTGYPLSVTGFSSFNSPLPEGIPSLAELFQASGFRTTGYTGVGNTGSVFNFHRGYDEYFELYREDGFRRKSQEYLPYLIPWLEARQDRPFFLYVHFKEPHAVYIPLPPFQGLFSDAYPEKADLANFVRQAETLTEGQVEYIRACYDESLSSVDAVFGTVVETLDRLDLLERSLIILTADHGEMLGEKDRIFSHGESFAEGGIHIPLIIRIPAGSSVSGPRSIDALVKTSDVFMTLADIYGFPVIEELMDGRSLLPLLLEPDQEVNSTIFLERLEPGAYACRTDRYKLIDRPYLLRTELYDLAADPLENTDISLREDIVTGVLKSRLRKWLDRQKTIRIRLFQDRDPGADIDPSQIDPKTLENLKALGYIK